jgi:hypothetical protein
MIPFTKTDSHMIQSFVDDLSPTLHGNAIQSIRRSSDPLLLLLLV